MKKNLQFILKNEQKNNKVRKKSRTQIIIEFNQQKGTKLKIYIINNQTTCKQFYKILFFKFEKRFVVSRHFHLFKNFMFIKKSLIKIS